jgi:glycosyltransferase involved in cell wall biosynthesis
MRVLVFHGYLLRGTGSNVYNARLAEALVRLGHEVHLVCQERHAAELEFVGTVGDWDTGSLVVRRMRDTPCTVYRPNIGGLLPVYVADRYEGIEARPFPQLSEAELERYLRANVDAVSEVVSLSLCDVALANHLVMGPAILARALSGTGLPYAVTVHGSALEYTVKPHPRFLPYAREGVAGANTVLVGSRHTAESLWAALDEPSLRARTRLGPPGVDVRRFRPADREAAVSSLWALSERIASRAHSSTAGGGDASAQIPTGSSFSRDDAGTANALATLAGSVEEGPIVAFVGKLIISKGIDLLLVAWPLVLAAVPAARLAVVGFGAYRAAAERLTVALSSGELAVVQKLAAVGRAAEGGPPSTLDFVNAFLDWLERDGDRAAYLGAAAQMLEHVIFTDRLEHEELADVLPLCDAMVIPSTFPEAFGMVAVEAAACGALPISADHSGLAEVSRRLARGLPEPVRPLTSFPLGSEVVRSIATRVIDWLLQRRELREATRAALVQTVAARYSWEGVARGVIAAARGELSLLDAPDR